MPSITSNSNQLQVRFKELHRLLLSSYEKLYIMKLHQLSLKLRKHSVSTEGLSNIWNSRSFKMICFKVLAAFQQENTKQLICKNNKINNLKIKFNKLPKDKYDIPVLNLSSESLNLSSLKYGLHQSFVDENKYVKRNVAAEMESIAVRLDKYVDVSMKETFDEFLRSFTTIISNNIYSEKDNTVKLLLV